MAQSDSAKPQGVDLSKLTVAQLKAICKERKISGYSKLGKPALLQKLQGTPLSLSGDPASAGLENLQTGLHATAPTSSDTGVAQIDPTPASKPQTATAAKTKSKARKTAPSATDSARQIIKPSSAPVSENVPSILVPGPGASLDECASLAAAISSRLPSPVVTTPAPQVTIKSLARAANGVSDAIASSDTPAASLSLPPLAPKEKAKKRKKLVADKDTMPPPPPKKPRIQPPITISQERPGETPAGTVSEPASASRTPSKTSDVSCPVPARLASVSDPAVTKPISTVTLPAKRFRPLVLHKPKISPASAPVRPAVSTSNATVAVTSSSPQGGPIPLYYLDLPAPFAELPTLKSITLPPPLAQRKRVTRWAIILSGLSDAERAVCVLVSRTFRYAVYLSASSILARDYQGKRLDTEVMRKYSQAMTNMWPYLRVRKAEVANRRRIYEDSFLPRLFQRCGFGNPIAKRLWASPDKSKQLVIAMRFVLTRAWFELSVGISSGGNDDPTSWLQGTVVDVQEVVKGEVWSVTLEHVRPRRQETLYLLEATCEVVGRPSKTVSHATDEDPIHTGLPVRADWSAYITRWNGSSSGQHSLLSQLKWACREEYDHGISTLWLKRTANEGELGAAKRQVARRYILASVVGNSISGEWMSTTGMAQDFAGLSSRGPPPAPSRIKDPKVNLYLPEHHHVESVHFSSPGGGPLHPALAVVQTPHREYYILRDNGMQVGCEEEGVAAVWREVLGCDHRGASA
ncbi:hypothetical protein C2E23DRAFT_829735 [Lenzites betulinus]|nr:hypothetical protein C2E23DRAFT_829735 [Lenzites betulinus]